MRVSFGCNEEVVRTTAPRSQTHGLRVWRLRYSVVPDFETRRAKFAASYGSCRRGQKKTPRSTNVYRGAAVNVPIRRSSTECLRRMATNYSELLIVPKVVLAFVPNVVMAVRQTTMINASMTAYSTAVGPPSDLRKRFRAFIATSKKLCGRKPIGRPVLTNLLAPPNAKPPFERSLPAVRWHELA